MLYAEFNGETTWASEFDRDLADTNSCKDGLEQYPLCPDCGERVTHRNESANGRGAHFAHCPSGGGGGGGGDCDGSTVGEREEHKAMKDIAASVIGFALSSVEVASAELERDDLPAPHTDKTHREADCFIEFERPDPQLGEGLLIEVQFKNKSKDKTATTLDYLQADGDYSVLWLWEDDFHTDADSPKDWTLLVDEQAVRDRVRRQIWPINNPESIWDPERTFDIACGVSGLSTLWRDSDPDSVDTAELIHEVAKSSETSPPDATVAGTAIDGLARRYKETKDWEDLFPGVGWSEVLTQEVRDGLGLPDVTVPASFVNLPKLEPAKLRERCPACNHRHDLTPPADGEVCRGKTCRRCNEWFTVFDKREKA